MRRLSILTPLIALLLCSGLVVPRAGAQSMSSTAAPPAATVPSSLGAQLDSEFAAMDANFDAFAGQPANGSEQIASPVESGMPEAGMVAASGPSLAAPTPPATAATTAPATLSTATTTANGGGHHHHHKHHHKHHKGHNNKHHNNHHKHSKHHHHK